MGGRGMADGAGGKRADRTALKLVLPLSQPSLASQLPQVFASNTCFANGSITVGAGLPAMRHCQTPPKSVPDN